VGTSIGLGGFFSKDEILAVAYTRAFEWEYDKHQDHGENDSHTAASSPDNRTARLVAYQNEQEAPGAQPDEKKRLYGGALRMGDRAHEAGEKEHAAPGRTAIFARIPPLPKWLFYLAVFTAYVTPFYMMRCWWMTFMGKPRDQHVYDHAHEIPLMYVPLVVLAVGTFVASYFLFRDLIADAAPAATTAAMVLATDGESHTQAISAAHHWLKFGVGGAFIVGFLLAIAIYWRGLATAEAIKRAAWPLHTLLVRKYYFDEVYNLVWVKGCLLLSRIARLIDTYLVDLIFDLSAAATERFAAFSGLILDNHGVDGVINGVAKTSVDVAGVVRTPQTGRIRHYVLFAAAVAVVVLVCILWFGTAPGAAALMTAGSVGH
jgi:NADH:ubiquinone oxidoreductase subunit 5 (subunit L)/multisubunit Na+/H+ antiporter MnhA subunit